MNRNEQPASPKEPQGYAARLWLFAILAICISAVGILVSIIQTGELAEPIANPNKLAIGALAKVSGTIDLPLEPPCELDDLTQKQIVAMRTNYVNKHPELLSSSYDAFAPVWSGIVDKRPWWGIKGFYWNPVGQHNEEGPSLAGPLVANPFLLTAPHFSAHREWNNKQSTNPSSPSFPFTCLPTDLKWTPSKSLMEETIDLTSFYRAYQESGGNSPFSVIARAMIEDYNALDMGYNWKYIGVVGKEPLTPEVVRVYSFLHGGKTMGIPCNNVGTWVQSDWKAINLQPGTDVEVKLWRDRPQSISSPADATCIWHVR